MSPSPSLPRGHAASNPETRTVHPLQPRAESQHPGRDRREVEDPARRLEPPAPGLRAGWRTQNHPAESPDHADCSARFRAGSGGRLRPVDRRPARRHTVARPGRSALPSLRRPASKWIANHLPPARAAGDLGTRASGAPRTCDIGTPPSTPYLPAERPRTAGVRRMRSPTEGPCPLQARRGHAVLPAR
jgi:hypothetical protein